MAQNVMLYYPFTTFQNREFMLQSLLYFDKVYLIDPVMAAVEDPQESKGEVPQELMSSDIGREIMCLHNEGILQFVDPRKVIGKNETSISNNILEDVRARDFQHLLSDEYPEYQHRAWQLSVMKIPGRLENYEEAMLDARSRRTNLNLANMAQTYVDLTSAARDPDFREAPATKLNEMYEAQLNTPEEVRLIESVSGQNEYRLVPTSFIVGEAIMINQALHAANLLYEENKEVVTPITDDRVHHDFLMLKYKRATESSLLKTILKDYDYLENTAINLATKELMREEIVALKDVPLQEVLNFREKHASDLQSLRDRIADWQVQVESEFWDDTFAQQAVKLARSFTRELGGIQAELKDWRKYLVGKGFISMVQVAPLSLVKIAIPAMPIPLLLAAGAGIAMLSTVLEYWKKRTDFRRNSVAFLLDARALATT